MDVLFVVENLVKMDILVQVLGLMCSMAVHRGAIQNHEIFLTQWKLWEPNGATQKDLNIKSAFFHPRR